MSNSGACMGRILFAPTVGAQPGNFKRVVSHQKPVRLRHCPNRLAELVTVYFLGDATVAAQKKFALMVLARCRTSYKGVEAVNAINESLLQQKVQRAVDRWRCYPPRGQLCQLIHKRVCA